MSTLNDPAFTRSDRQLTVVALTAFVVLRIVVPLTSSLWVDELGTYWVIDGDLAQTVDRAATYHGQTPLYYVLLEGVTGVFGSSELALRSLSLATFAAGLVVFFRFADRIAGRSAAVVSTAGLLTFPSFTFTAADARPYALALLGLIVATDLLDRWLTHGGYARGIVYAVAAAFVWWSHYVFVVALGAHAVIWALRRREDGAPSSAEVTLIVAVFGALVAPTVPQIRALSGRTEELVFSSQPSAVDAMSALLIPLLAVALVVALVARVMRHSEESVGIDRRALVVGGAGAVVPIFLLFLIGTVSDVVLWDARYRIAITPFAALLLGSLVAALAPRIVRQIAIGILLVATAVPVGGHSNEDWRGAVEALNEHVTQGDLVLLGQGLIENTSSEFVADPDNISYLTSAVTYYSTPATAVPLPIVMTGSDARALLGPVIDTLDGEQTVAVVRRTLGGDVSLLAAQFMLEERGYSVRALTRHGSVEVMIFERA